MNAQQVVDKIISEANAQAEVIMSEAKARADAEQRQLDTELQAYNAQTQDMAKAAAEDKRQRMLAAARMDNSKAHLAAKGQLLNEVYEKAAETINTMPEETYQELMSAFMVKAVETGDEHVLVGKKDTRLNDKVIRNVNRILGPGYKGNLSLVAERVDISGGFILRRGNVRINVSTEVLLSQVREKMEMRLAGQLFGAGEDKA